MKRFTLAAVIGSLRQVLAILILLLAIPTTAYLVSRKLSNPDHYQYGFCPSEGFVYHAPPPPCSPPTRAAWQIPVAVVIAIGGLGAAVAVASTRSRRHAGAPEERRVLRA